VLSLRIVTTSAVFLTLAASGASAQTATTTAAGKPLPLLQIYQKNGDTAAVTPHHHARYAHRRAVRTPVANHANGAIRDTFMQVQPAPEPQPETTRATTQSATTTAAPSNIWPTPDLTLPGMEGLVPAPTAAAPFASTPVAPMTPVNPNEVLAAAYHTVQAGPQVTPPSAEQVTPRIVAQITPPSAEQATLPNPVQVAQANTVSPTDVAPDQPHDAANTAKPSNPVPSGPIQQVMIATAEPQNPNPVGSPIWIAHVLAALGGAIAAGAVAWFLINPLPVRSYE
jgi:hypothetical protein